MNSEPFHPDVPTDAAVIHRVTPERLEEAAHRAAQLADDVAHHVVASPVAATVEADAAPVETDAVEPQRDAVEAAGAAVVETAEIAGRFAETAVEAARDAVRPVEEAATPSVAAAGPPVDPVGRYNAALLGMVRANVAATGDLFAALVKARSVPEVVAINTDHLRRQFDTMTTQGRELAQLAQTLAFDALKPLAGSGRRDG